MNSIEKVILEVLDTNHPDNVRELILLVQKQVDASTEEIQQQIKSLHKQGLLDLEDPTTHQPFFRFVFQKPNLWFWVIIAISGLSFGSILLIPENQIPLSYVRYSFGFVLVAFLPGFCLTETLFPKKQALDLIERVTFSIGLSFATTALVGLLLSFTPFGLTLSTALPTLGGLVIALAVVALIRKYKKQ
jgi:hypothetical protein